MFMCRRGGGERAPRQLLAGARRGGGASGVPGVHPGGRRARRRRARQAVMQRPAATQGATQATLPLRPYCFAEGKPMALISWPSVSAGVLLARN